jgi:hypothetical protein
MHGGWQLFSSTLLVEVRKSLLIKWIALYALISMWRRGQREKHTCALARRAGHGVVRRWARAHDVRVNSPSKSGSKLRRLVASFYRLFLLRVHV